MNNNLSHLNFITKGGDQAKILIEGRTEELKQYAKQSIMGMINAYKGKDAMNLGFQVMTQDNEHPFSTDDFDLTIKAEMFNLGEMVKKITSLEYKAINGELLSQQKDINIAENPQKKEKKVKKAEYEARQMKILKEKWVSFFDNEMQEVNEAYDNKKWRDLFVATLGNLKTYLEEEDGMHSLDFDYDAENNLEGIETLDQVYDTIGQENENIRQGNEKTIQEAIENRITEMEIYMKQLMGEEDSYKPLSTGLRTIFMAIITDLAEKSHNKQAFLRFLDTYQKLITLYDNKDLPPQKPEEIYNEETKEIRKAQNHEKAANIRYFMKHLKRHYRLVLDLHNNDVKGAKQKNPFASWASAEEGNDALTSNKYDPFLVMKDSDLLKNLGEN